MIKYVSPAMEVEKFDAESVVTTASVTKVEDNLCDSFTDHLIICTAHTDTGGGAHSVNTENLF